MAENYLPPFAYMIGIQRTTKAPELVIGLKQPIAHFILNKYNRRVQQGEKFSKDQMYSGFLEDFECTFKKVDRTHYPEYLGWARWLYKRQEFGTLQIVYPNASGNWPWQNKASQYSLPN
jgi:Domain of unknown function (DUF4262)